jgi:IS5 family transposase
MTYVGVVCQLSQMAMQSLPDSLIRRAEPALQKCTFDLELELLDFSSLCESKERIRKIGTVLRRRMTARILEHDLVRKRTLPG